jgi:DNA-binding NarL/FixJ family response regulator
MACHHMTIACTPLSQTRVELLKSATMPTRILIADDHPLFRAALRSAVVAAAPDAMIAEADDLAGALAHIDAEPETDLALLDLHMRDSHGLTGLAALRAQFPSVAAMVVSASEDVSVVRRAFDHGAVGFVPKSAPPDEIVKAIRAVLDGERWIPPSLERTLESEPGDPADTELAARLSRLTSQQFRVLAQIGEGRLNKQIADSLGVQERTIKAHVSVIFEKLGVRNRTQASIVLQRLRLQKK